MTKDIHVVKRDGTRELYQVEKIQKQIEYACDGIEDVSQSLIEVNMNLEVYDGITTSHIDQLGINAAVNLINPADGNGNTNYQFVAGRLQNSVLRKTVYGQFQPWPLLKVIRRGVDLGLLDEGLLTWYSEDEWATLDSAIDHTRDERLSYSAVKQFSDKYLVRNRVTKEIIDTPQIRYMVAAATIFNAEEKDRLSQVVNYYNHTSRGEFTLPTPQLAGLGTPTRQFSSCVLLRSDDTMDSIFATGEMVAKYSGKRAGIGLEVGRLRPLGASIRNGEVAHTGMIPFLKKWYADLKCAAQGGLRNSSCTVNWPWWHAEFESLIVLKNNRGTDDNRVRHMDYAVAVNRFLMRRFKNQEMVSLFDPNQVPDLYEAFYRDTAEFERLYLKYEQDPKLSKKKFPAVDVVNSICSERSDTGRIYLFFVDNVIDHVPFETKIHPVYQTNLCVSGDTIIETNLGNLKIEDLVQYKGEEKVYVKSFFTDFGLEAWVQATVAARTAEDAELFLIEYEGKSIRCTGDHKFFTKNRGWVPAKDLEEKDELVTSEIDEIDERNGVIKKTKLLQTEPVYDLTVPGTECFFANGLLIHNCVEITLPTQPFQRLTDRGESLIRFKSPRGSFEGWFNNESVVFDGKDFHEARYLKNGQYVSTIDETFIESEIELLKQRNPAIALCTLASNNWGKYKKPEQMRNACRAVVRGLDNILNFQDYLAPQAHDATMDFRPLGVGVTNLAYWHAKRGLKYGEPAALKEIARWMEHQSYYLIEASVELAKERGACLKVHETKWAKGEFPHERSPKALDEIREWEPTLDWEKLRADLLKYGIRNATLGAIAPVESSSVCVDSTNGIEIPKSLVSVKDSRGSILVQVVPEYQKLKNNYQTMWDLDDCEPYLMTAATMAQFIDQSISTNTFNDPSKFPGNKVPRTRFIKNIMNAQRWGLPTLYYHMNRKQGAKMEHDEKVEEVCEACVL